MTDPILITGARGFIGRNLIARLRTERPEYELLPFSHGQGLTQLAEQVERCGFIYHLAGVNPAGDPLKLWPGNRDFTETLLSFIRRSGRKGPIVFCGTTAGLDSEYGRSKKAAEDLLHDYERETRTQVHILRPPTVFGPGGHPPRNGVAITFCHQVAHDLPIRIDEPEKELTLVHIDDLTMALMDCLVSPPGGKDVQPTYRITVGQLVALIRSFRDESLPPLTSGSLAEKLYRTYLSYLPAGSPRR